MRSQRSLCPCRRSTARVQLEVAAQARRSDRASSHGSSFASVAVRLRVVARRVAAHAIGDRLDQRRALRRARARAIASRVTLHDGEDVVAVDAHAGDAVGDALARRTSATPSDARSGTLMAQPLLRQKKTVGHLEHAREVHPVVEIATSSSRRRRSRRARPGRPCFDLGGPGEADGLRDLRADRRADRGRAATPCSV